MAAPYFQKISTSIVGSYEIEVSTIASGTFGGRALAARGLLTFWALNEKGRRLARSNATAVIQFDASALDDLHQLLGSLAHTVRRLP